MTRLKTLTAALLVALSPLAALAQDPLRITITDGVIDPLDTRTWISLGNEAASQAPAKRDASASGFPLDASGEGPPVAGSAFDGTGGQVQGGGMELVDLHGLHGFARGGAAPIGAHHAFAIAASHAQP